jgi:hypothetical protein
MFIRMKAKYYFGVTNANVPTAGDPVLSRCVKEVQRRSLKEDFEAGKITEDDYDKKRKTLLHRGQSKGNPPRLLALELNHGDLIVMHGAELQKYYEVRHIQALCIWRVI